MVVEAQDGEIVKNVRNSVEEGELTCSFSRLRTVLVKCTTITQDSMGEKVGNKLKIQLLSPFAGSVDTKWGILQVSAV